MAYGIAYLSRYSAFSLLEVPTTSVPTTHYIPTRSTYCTYLLLLRHYVICVGMYYTTYCWTVPGILSAE